MIGVVERRADEVVHRRVDDDEILALAALDVDDRGHQHAGVADDEAPRLENDLAAEAAGAARDDFRVTLGARRRIVVEAIGDAEAAAEVDMVDSHDRRRAIRATKSASSAKASSNGRMSVICEPICMSTPVTARPGRVARAGVDGARARDRNAELVFRLARWRSWRGCARRRPD